MSQPPRPAQDLPRPACIATQTTDSRSICRPELVNATEQPASSVSPFAAFLPSGPSNAIRPRFDNCSTADLSQLTISRLGITGLEFGSTSQLSQWTASQRAWKDWLCAHPQNAAQDRRSRHSEAIFSPWHCFQATESVVCGLRIRRVITSRLTARCVEPRPSASGGNLTCGNQYKRPSAG